MLRKYLIRLSIIPLCILLPATASLGGAIKKCQDETGKWHYGDTAAEECSSAKVIEMSDKGFKKRVIEAPATEEELETHKEEERQRKLAKEQKKRDNLLISTYAHEDDIIYLRDRKLHTLSSHITASEQTLAPLRAALARMEAQAAEEQQKGGKAVSEETARHISQTKAQITRHEAALEEKKRERELTRVKYDEELKRYRELKSTQPGGASAPKGSRP